MKPDRLKQIEELYHRALERAGHERERFLKDACGADEQLREEVSSLLAQQGESGFIVRPAVEGAEELSEESTVLTEGSQLGSYQILSLLGRGGMGEVYRARDSKLRREVAIKVLPPSFALDPDRVQRFEREARLLASLNHPNIAAIYGLEEHEGTRFLVLELVEGETLADRLVHGPIPLEESLDLTVQIAEALETAHERGVIHRDLKPANIKVTPDGKVKVLDFGLAKAFTGEAGGPAPSDMSTVSMDGTEAGRILGTPFYMSPEQAQGKPVDKRTDIWAFGCVTYEVLTARRPFQGETVAGIIASILKDEPDWKVVPRLTPTEVVGLLRRSLRKDAALRLRDIGDARIQLEEVRASTGRPVTARTHWRSWTAGAAAALLLSVATFMWFSSDGSTFDNPLAGATFTRIVDFAGAEPEPAISPDGRFVAFVSDQDGPFDVWVTQVGTGRYVNLTQGELDGRSPMRDVGFVGDGSEIWLSGAPDKRMRLIPLIGGSPRNILGENVVNADWSPDGRRIVYHLNIPGDPVFVADSNGTNRQEIIAAPPGEHQHYPAWSTDGQWIYLVRGTPATGEMDLWRVRPDGGELERLTQNSRNAAFPTPIDTSTVLYTAQEASGAGPWLWAMDVERRLVQRVSFGAEAYTSIGASADGSRLVASVADPQVSLWSVPISDDLATETDVTPFEVPTARALAPRFGARSLFYLSSPGNADGLWRYRDGEAMEIWRGSESALLEPAAVSPDEDLVTVVLRQGGRQSLNVLSADGAELETLSETLDIRGAASWSPDGQWIVTGAEDADGPGLFRIDVNNGAHERLATGQALNPVWSPDGSLIVYAGVNVNTIAPLRAVRSDGTPVELPNIEVRREGERFRFLPDGPGLVYMQGLRTSQDFWLLDFATMESRQLTELDAIGAMRTFDITPDGGEIVFDRQSGNSDIVLIERNGGQ